MEPTYALAKAILKPWLTVWFRWSIEGLDNIPPRGPAIVAFNHIAYLDPFATAFVVDRAARRPRFLAKQELFDDKRIAWVLRGAKQIPVKRGSREAPMALDHALRALEEGEVVVVVPEGTVTTDPDLQPSKPKSGAARLALRSGAPIVPAAVWGTANIWPKGYRKRWTPRQDIAVRIGRPIRATGDPDDPGAWDAVSERVMDEISVMLAGLRPAIPDRRRPKKRAA